MEKPFKNEQTNLLFHRWISNCPEIHHPYDRERFYDFVYSLLENREGLSETILTDSVNAEKNWTKEFVTEFVDLFLDKYFLIKEIWEFIGEKKNITCP